MSSNKFIRLIGGTIKHFAVFALIVVFVSGLYYASSMSVSDTVSEYYKITANEDLNAYMNILDTSKSTDESIKHTRAMAKEVFDKYDTDTHKVSNLKYIVDGDYALAKYTLYAKISGAESFDYTLTYIMLLHNIDGKQKVSFVMPLHDYLKLTEETRKSQIVNDMVETEEEKYNQTLEVEDEQTSGDVNVYFDGEPMGNLSDSLKKDIYSCTTDEYCKNNNLGDTCNDGLCSNYEDENPLSGGLCSPLFVLIGVGASAVGSKIFGGLI